MPLLMQTGLASSLAKISPTQRRTPMQLAFIVSHHYDEHAYKRYSVITYSLIPPSHFSNGAEIGVNCFPAFIANLKQ